MEIEVIIALGIVIVLVIGIIFSFMFFLLKKIGDMFIDLFMEEGKKNNE